MHSPSSPIPHLCFSKHLLDRFQFLFLLNILLVPPSLLSILHLLLSPSPSPLSPPLSFPIPTLSFQLVQGPYSLPSPFLLSPFPFPSPLPPLPPPLSHLPLQNKEILMKGWVALWQYWGIIEHGAAERMESIKESANKRDG